MTKATLVVPCFNEACRLDSPALLRLAALADASVLLVDDGSTDQTLPMLRAVAAQAPQAVRVLALEANHGKGEAVRRGLTLALASGAELVGYVDANLSTPVEEMGRLVERARTSSYSVVIGARIVMLGTEIDRNPVRHSFGRLFATAAATVLGQGIYDTQCGAKVFKRSELLVRALQQPFASRWTFDVELLGRLLVGTADLAPLPASALIEVPLLRWHHTAGSKFHPLAMVRATLDLALVARNLRAFRATSDPG